MDFSSVNDMMNAVSVVPLSSIGSPTEATGSGKRTRGTDRIAAAKRLRASDDGEPSTVVVIDEEDDAADVEPAVVPARPRPMLVGRRRCYEAAGSAMCFSQLPGESDELYRQRMNKLIRFHDDMGATMPPALVHFAGEQAIRLMFSVSEPIRVFNEHERRPWSVTYPVLKDINAFVAGVPGGHQMFGKVRTFEQVKMLVNYGDERKVCVGGFIETFSSSTENRLADLPDSGRIMMLCDKIQDALLAIGCKSDSYFIDTFYALEQYEDDFARQAFRVPVQKEVSSWTVDSDKANVRLWVVAVEVGKGSRVISRWNGEEQVVVSDTVTNSSLAIMLLMVPAAVDDVQILVETDSDKYAPAVYACLLGNHTMMKMDGAQSGKYLNVEFVGKEVRDNLLAEFSGLASSLQYRLLNSMYGGAIQIQGAEDLSVLDDYSLGRAYFVIVQMARLVTGQLLWHTSQHGNDYATLQDFSAPSKLLGLTSSLGFGTLVDSRLSDLLEPGYKSPMVCPTLLLPSNLVHLSTKKPKPHSEAFIRSTIKL